MDRFLKGWFTFNKVATTFTQTEKIVLTIIILLAVISCGFSIYYWVIGEDISKLLFLTICTFMLWVWGMMVNNNFAKQIKDFKKDIIEIKKDKY